MSKNSQLQENSKVEREIEEFIRRNYEEVDVYSGNLSSILRQLAFAEGVLFWFCYEQFNISIIIISFGWAFLLLYFVCDSIQYLLGYMHFKRQGDKYFKDYYEKKILNLDNYIHQDMPQSLNWMFRLKILTIVFSSVILLFGFLMGIYCTNN
ncbi:hypothetical protein [Legionella pneumophila]